MWQRLSYTTVRRVQTTLHTHRHYHSCTDSTSWNLVQLRRRLRALTRYWQHGLKPLVAIKELELRQPSSNNYAAMTPKCAQLPRWQESWFDAVESRAEWEKHKTSPFYKARSQADTLATRVIYPWIPVMLSVSNCLKLWAAPAWAAPLCETGVQRQCVFTFYS